MSLINEALKKAQRQRTEAPVVVEPSSTPSAANTTARIAKHRPPVQARTQLLIIGGGVALLLMCGVFAFIFISSDTPPPAPPPRPRPAEVVATPPDQIAPLPVQPVVVTVPPTADPIVPPRTTPAPTVATTTTPAPTIPVTPAAVVAKPDLIEVRPTPAPVPPTVNPVASLKPKANPRVYEFLETLRVSGIRASDTDPKVIMNDRVYRLNDLVDRATQLRLLRVDASSLTFVDASGFEYRKTF